MYMKECLMVSHSRDNNKKHKTREISKLKKRYSRVVGKPNNFLFALEGYM